MWQTYKHVGTDRRSHLLTPKHMDSHITIYPPQCCCRWMIIICYYILPPSTGNQSVVKMKSSALLPSNLPTSTDRIYHRAAKRRADKFDRSMTRGKLLGNNALLFIFISILIMTQLISFLWKNENTKFTRLTAVRTGSLGLLPVNFIGRIKHSSCPLT